MLCQRVWLPLALLLCVTSSLLIFMGESLRERPGLVSVLLLTLNCLSLFVYARLLSSPGSCKSGLAKRKAGFRSYLPLLLLSLLFVSFGSAPLYFSDDALRHIHDGYYLLTGVDVYSIPPRELPQLLSQQPNHPELPTIYFPVTQAQAMLGAFFSVRYGFRFVYLIVCILLVWTVWRLSYRRDRVFWLTIFFSPWFLIFLSSHHADLQGFLLLSFVGLWLKRRHRSCSEDPSSRRLWLSYFMIAFLAALLPGLKPEGGWWFLYLSVWVFCQSPPLLGRPGLPVGLAWLGGAMTCLALQAGFAWYFLFPSEDSFFSFYRTTRLFMDWFLAYNPLLELRLFLYETTFPRPEIYGLYRKQVLALALMCLCMLPGLFLMKKVSRRQANTFPLFLGPKARLQMLLKVILVTGLLAALGARGTWHPWYFLWLLPALWGSACWGAKNRLAYRLAFFLSSSLVLFYIPVAYLRAGEAWQMQFFYAAFGCSLLFWLCTQCKSIPLFRMDKGMPLTSLEHRKKKHS